MSRNAQSRRQENQHHEEIAIDVQEQGGFADFASSVEKRFLKSKIRRRECKCFIEKSGQKPEVPDDERFCCCGYMKKDHPQNVLRNPSTGTNWNPGDHTSTRNTDAYGEIEFVGYGDKVAKFARVDVDTSMETMMEMLTKAWGEKPPNLLISVTGGAKFFDIKNRLREVFRRGLMKAALSTGAWIITGGTNTGVMKIVGEAVRDYGPTAEERVITIGVAPWGCVQNKECLINTEGTWPATYRIEGEPLQEQSFLDPNHSHFVLVDNGTQLQFKVEIPFRAELEKTIGAQKTDTGADAVPVPVCLLVLNGGIGTLETVHSAIKSRTPTIIIKGSGKAADILAYAHQNVREVTACDHKGKNIKEVRPVLAPSVIAEISDMVKDKIGDEDLTKHVEWIRESVLESGLMSVFELDSKNSATDVDRAILKALLKANKDQVMNQLKLALAWNRIDVAKSEIFTHEKNWATGKLDDVMLSAIKLDRVDFVELFLDHGVSLKDFLSGQRLIELYNSIPKNCLLYNILTKTRHKHRKSVDENTSFTLEDVGHLIQLLLGDFIQPDYLTNPKLKCMNLNTIKEEEKLSPCLAESNDDFPHPAQELFIWAILTNKDKLSKLFWREAKESVGAALFGHACLKALQKYTLDAQVLIKLRANADEYEKLAIGVINTCYSSDEKRAHDILIRNMPNWGSTTCVSIAYHSKTKRFIAQTACRSLLSAIWLGKIKHDNGFMKIFLCSIIFPLIPCLIRFQDKITNVAETEMNAVEEPKEPQKDEKRPMTRKGTKKSLLEKSEIEHAPSKKKRFGVSKFYTFYSAPVVKFCTSVFFYLGFLCLFSYILVVQLTEEFHFLEGVLIFWVFSIFAEEIRQFSMTHAHTFKSKLKYYLYDKWNILDILTISFFTLGMILRFLGTSDTLAAARILLSLNLITFFLRVLHIFSINSKLGPMLVMISDMVQDLLLFVCILLVFVFSYAIASEAILYPNSELNWKLLYYLPRKAYWHIYGELFMEDIEVQNTSCTNDPSIYKDYSELRCPSDTGRYVVPILLGFYMLLTHVLLLNLLIAMFSYTFQKIKETSDTHWCFQQFSLVHEYTERPVLPPPFIIVSHVILVFKKCFQPCKKKGVYSNDKFCKRFDNTLEKLEEKKLIQWENVIGDNYLSVSEKTEANSIDGRVKTASERLEHIMTKVEDIHEGHGSVVVEKRLESLENQRIHTTKALEWIMQALQDGNMGSKEPRPILPNIEKQ